MRTAKDITNDLAQEAFADALRRRVGPGKSMSVDELAESTGIDRRTIDSYRQGDSAPNWQKTLQIVFVLGEGFLNEIMRPAASPAVPCEPGDVVTSTADILAEVSHRIHDDGIFCHRDKASMAPKLIEHGTDLIKTGTQWMQESNLVQMPVVGKVS